MADKTWWMTPEQMSEYERISKRLRDLGEEHRPLIEMAKKRALDEAGWARLRDVNREANELFAKRKALEDKNPILPKNLVGG